MQFGAIGDVHGDGAALRRVLGRHPDVPFWVCVGDLGGDEGEYEDPPGSLYWVKGNNEDFHAVARLAAGDPSYPHLHHIPNGRTVEASGLSIAGLGGTFAPTWYDTPAADLPYPALEHAGPAGARGPTMIARDKRRHFVREEVEACKAMRNVDIFLSHEAPRPFFVGARDGRGRRGNDAGKTAINEILAEMKPRLHLFGHHHRFDDKVRQGVRSICLDLVSRSYLLFDAETLDYVRLDT